MPQADALSPMSLELLSPPQRQQFYEQGYLVLPKLIPQSTCGALRQAAGELVAGFEPARDIGAIFSTQTHAHERDRYFLASDSNVSFFFEEEALASDGSLKVAKEVAINKIGHALHTQHPAFREFSAQAALRQAVADLGFLRQPVVMQSMYIFKQPHIGGEVTCHQDATFIHTRPNRVLAAWFALEDAHRDNGCLWGLPGVYGESDAPRRLFVRGEEACQFVQVAGEERRDARPWDLSQLVPLEVPEGSVIFFHGLFPHLSYANRSAHSRHAYTMHMIDAQGEYLPSNWIRLNSQNTLAL